MQHLKLTPLPAPHRYPLQSLHHQRGMTLVEWMVSITIGLVLLAGLTALIARQSSTQAELEKSSRQIENGRYAMQLLNEDI
ncbi:MAG: PilW family protein, partial [Polaromonas sp.]